MGCAPVKKVDKGAGKNNEKKDKRNLNYYINIYTNRDR